MYGLYSIIQCPLTHLSKIAEKWLLIICLLAVLDAIQTFIYMFYVNRCWDLCILGYDSKTLITLLKVSTKKTIVPLKSFY